MIFVTVGTQLPFDRLLHAMDEWAAENSDIPVFAQIGDSETAISHMECVRKLSPQEYAAKFDQAKVVVSHVGMGTIISGLEAAKPLVLMPRLASLGEHRNDHQLGTAEKFSHYKQIHIVNSPEELKSSVTRGLDEAMVEGGLKPEPSPALLDKLRAFVEE